MGKPKLTDVEVRDFVESLGWSLLAPYEGSRRKLVVSCPEGHESALYLHNLRKGQCCSRCVECPGRVGTAFIEFGRRGLRLLESRYRNNRVPMRCRCQCGHEFHIPLSRVLGGKPCPRCFVRSGRSRQ